MGWKERGVDRLATYLVASGNPNVYAYRFDWDEEGIDWGYDLSKAIGAGHALETAFGFGNFTDGIGVSRTIECLPLTPQAYEALSQIPLYVLRVA